MQGGKRLRRSALGRQARSKGGKRPRSSMSPTIVLLPPDGERDAQSGRLKPSKPLLALGAPGGSMIIGVVARDGPPPS